MATDELNVGLLLFPEMTQLDLTGPYEVFVSLPRNSLARMSPRRFSCASNATRRRPSIPARRARPDPALVARLSEKLKDRQATRRAATEEAAGALGLPPFKSRGVS
jgi:hypothetical protein